MAKKSDPDDTSALSGEEYAKAVEANPWPGNVVEKNPDAVEGYESHFDPAGTTRRVLGHITDEDHVGRGGRNTTARLAQELAEDPFTAIGGGQDDQVQKHLDDLVEAGLVEERDDGTYGVTDAGRVELAN